MTHSLHRSNDIILLFHLLYDGKGREMMGNAGGQLGTVTHLHIQSKMVF